MPINVIHMYMKSQAYILTPGMGCIWSHRPIVIQGMYSMYMKSQAYILTPGMGWSHGPIVIQGIACIWSHRLIY